MACTAIGIFTAASNQDYWQIGVNGFDPGKELETVDLRHADIGNDNAIILKSNAVQRIQCAWKISNLKTGKLQAFDEWRGGAPRSSSTRITEGDLPIMLFSVRCGKMCLRHYFRRRWPRHSQ